MARAGKKTSLFRDEITTRRNRLMMWARFPALLLALISSTLLNAFWPAMLIVGAWYAAWLVWVAGVFND